MLALDVTEPSQIAAARRQASSAAAASGFDEVHVGQVALAVTELATNLLKHGGGGEMLAEAMDDRVVLLALDKGPGMDVEACIVDGYSTTGTRGAGLGALQRLAQHFEVASWAGRGTAVLVEIARNGRRAPDLPAYGLAVAKPGEAVSGDGWSAHVDGDTLTLFVIDGLGHGIEAAIVANEGVRQFEAHCGEAPVEIIDAVHRALRHTRGGAVAVARLSRATRTAVFAGLGNISGRCIARDGATRNMASLSGIVGHNARRIRAFEYPCASGLVLLHTDGLGTSWSLDRYPGLVAAHPLLVAGVLYRDFKRGRDDVTIVVARTELS